MRHIDTAEAAREIAAEILGTRVKPLVLVSTTPDGEFRFDAEVVALGVDGDADVATIVTGEATYVLENLLPPKTHVFGGAARSYPPDFGTDPDWHRSLLRFPGRPNDDLIEDALAQITVQPIEAPTRRTWVQAVVERASGSATGNVARLSNGQRVMVVADSLPPSLKLADALEAGGPVEGWLSGVDLAPEPATVDLSAFVDGVVTLARVVKATDLRATLILHPLAPEIVLRKRAVVAGVDDGDNQDVKVTDVVHVGETVRVRVVREKDDALALSLVDVDGDRAFIAPLPLLRGGLPWLREGVDAAAEAPVPTAPEFAAPDTPAPPPAAAPAPAPSVPSDASTARELAALHGEMAALKDAFLRLGREVRAGTDLETLDQLRDENTSLSDELHRARGSLRDQTATVSRLRQELREARAARPEPAMAGTRTDRSLWPDETSWLRHEITATWAARTQASEKREHPLAEYIFGPRFLASARTLGDQYIEKILRGVVDVLTDRAADIPGRELHRLREGQGGSDPYVTRADGAICWRVSLESNTASARRLHYWQLPGGVIELSRVVLHDDVAP